MPTYMSKFINNFSEKTAPIPSLLKDSTEFFWTDKFTQALKEIKSVLSSEPVLQFFDTTKETTVSVDASKSELGAVLLQNKLPCAYASEALTET